MYDTIIIGGGPAGLSAATYATRRSLKTLLISKDIGGQIMWANEIENYPGFITIKSVELAKKMEEQAKNLGTIIINDEIKMIKAKSDGGFWLSGSRDEYNASTIILALGLSPRRLVIPGEVEFAGRGVTYCATCDGPVFKNKTVAVVGGGNSALDAADFLCSIAKKVYLIHRRDQFRGFESLVEKVKSHDSLEMALNSEIKEIYGRQNVEGIKIAPINQTIIRDIPLDGVFIEIGRIANTDVVSEFVERNEKNQIIVSGKCETKTAGMFAAGDVTNGDFKQIVIAAGQGATAALSAYQYLQIKQGNPLSAILDRGSS